MMMRTGREATRAKRDALGGRASESRWGVERASTGGAGAGAGGEARAGRRVAEADRPVT